MVAWLCFTAVSNQPSGVLSLHLGESIGTQPNGLLVTNHLARPGRVIVVGEEPLLEATLGTDRQPEFILYGPVGRNYVIEANLNLENAAGWQPACEVTLTNLWQPFVCRGVTNQTLFFRARRD